ncbi:MAG: superoxide dismutase family protein [Clostridia bacterium]|nr:superoxide dismutase family protein [Clostridia bacterium]
MYSSSNELYRILKRLPDGAAVISGSPDNSLISGTVKFYQGNSAILVVADIFNLPSQKEPCQKGIFAFHIHSGAECRGNETDPFLDAGTHYNPEGCPHPYHKGDMPPLFAASGRAFLAFITDRFTVEEIIGKTVIIHSNPDDFTTQPSGNAGKKIACGVISKVKR